MSFLFCMLNIMNKNLFLTLKTMQPSKNTIISEGATHWKYGYFIEGEWVLIEPKNCRKENVVNSR